MKIKTDFVTNSSSTCFIVIFPEKITAIEQLEKFISGRFSKWVFRDILSQRGYDIKEKRKQVLKIIKDEVMGGTPISDFMTSERVEYGDYRRKFCKREEISEKELNENTQWSMLFYEELTRQQERAAYESAKKFLENIGKSGHLYSFEYRDEGGGIEAKMEHGDIFRKLPHIKISHH